MTSSSRSSKAAIEMRSKLAILSLAFVLLSFSIVAAQDISKRQLIVPLTEGGFVGFKSETAWTDTKSVAPELQPAPAIVGSQAVIDDQQVIHRVLADAAGRFVFGYDLWVAPNARAKQFKIIVRPLDAQRSEERRVGKECRCRRTEYKYIKIHKSI